MFDGSVRMLSTKLDAATLRAIITVNGGEVVPDLEPRAVSRAEVAEARPESVPKEASSPPPFQKK